jgi:hypothetical protein
VKTLQVPQPCGVLLERDQVQAVHFRQRAWVVKGTLYSYTLCDPWRTLPDLEGEKRVYHYLHTNHGEITIFERIRGPQAELGWFVAGWWD